MFSQFRHAVEQLAQQVPNVSPPNLNEEQRDRSRSLDIQPTRSASPLSSSQLAESALVSLRKSLASQRSAISSPTSRASPPSVAETRISKSNLEERLRRATFAIGEASNAVTPDTPSRASPSPTPPIPTQPRSLSPASTPLPRSPTLEASAIGDDPQITVLPVLSIPEVIPPVEHDTPSETPLSNSNEGDTAQNSREMGDIGTKLQLAESPAEEGSDPQLLEASADEGSINGLANSEIVTEQVSAINAPLEREVNSTVMPQHNSAVEELQERLKQVEQRFTDVSISFKRLQAEKLAADTVLRNLTPVETIQDNAGLRDYLKNMHSKTEMFQGEVKRLNGKLERYEDRLEELRDTHRLESIAQSDLIEKLRTQLKETEVLFQASEKAVTQAEEKLTADKTQSDQLQAEVERFKTIAKEEEEKRVKAISLLKTVRQKLVRAEKEKEDALKDTASMKDKDIGDKERVHAEKLKLQEEIEALHTEKEKFAAAQKAQFERELSLAKERYEKEISAIKGQLELDIIALKSTQAKEIGAKNSLISTLEGSLNNVTRDKNIFFEQLQLKQAEAESAQGHLESLQHQNTEVEFQLRESNDRLALLKEEYAECQREHETRSREPGTSAGDVAQMIASTEAKYEAKLADLRRGLVILEKERNEGEANWSRKLKVKVKELDELKRVLGSTTKSREADEGVVEQLKVDLAHAKEETRVFREQVAELPFLREKIQELKKATTEQENEINLKISILERQLGESKTRDAQLKQTNKTLREELRKVQSSAALLEKQRNPGVGYWTNRVSENASSESQTTSLSGSPSRTNSPTPSSATTNRSEEEVNLEYLRNVILQFLEHKEMRPNLVKVLSIILHFTPQETRRLIAKV